MAGELVASIVGGLGNQIFCWATAVAAAQRANLDLVLELSSYDRDSFGRNYLLSKLGISDVRTLSYNRLERAAIGALARISDRRRGYFRLAGRSFYTEPKGRLNLSLLENRLSGQCYLRGYWQSARYFADYAGEIRKAVKFEPCNPAYRSPDTVCVHIRSFKETTTQEIGRLSRDYYEAAYIKCYARISRPKFVIYSDDLEWAKDKKMLPETYEIGNQGHTSNCPEHDLCELISMSHFKNLIIANSTFSWWAAYLSEQNPWVQAPANARQVWYSEEPLPAEWDEV